MGEWRYSSTILELGTRWRSPQYLLHRRLGGLQTRSERCGEDKQLGPARNRTPAVQPVARHCTN
jgi:hypothetical protein